MLNLIEIFQLYVQKFDIRATSLNNYFDGLIKLFSDLCLVKFLNTLNVKC